MCFVYRYNKMKSLNPGAQFSYYVVYQYIYTYLTYLYLHLSRLLAPVPVPTLLHHNNTG